MINCLIQDAVKLLQGELSPVTGIAADGDAADALLFDAATTLGEHDLPPLRASRVLALYYAIALAMQSHSGCEEPGKASTRRILDGDYLYSLYLQMALKWEEYEFVSVLAPYIKSIQIKRAEGTPQDDLLLMGFATFISEESKQRRGLTAEAI